MPACVCNFGFPPSQSPSPSLVAYCCYAQLLAGPGGCSPVTYDKQQDFLMFLMYVFTLQLCPKNVQALSPPRAEGSPLLSDLCGGMIQQDAIEGKLA